MLDYIWSGLMLISVITAVITGRAELLTQAVFEGSTAAVTLLISLCGGMALWSGVMEIARVCGITKAISKVLRPVIRRIFPDVANDSSICEAICMNISANMLGLGNAATPFGLKAMKLMVDKQNSDVASSSMIRFVVINTASVQLIPTTVAQLRMEHGAHNPMDILPAVWITSAASLICALFAAFVLERVWKK
ncbi:MAG: spore maturation protein A [Clostridia bacterium]|nr:spore maturation protein A [Clostridia bacterium]